MLEGSDVPPQTHNFRIGIEHYLPIDRNLPDGAANTGQSTLRTFDTMILEVESRLSGHSPSFLR